MPCDANVIDALPSPMAQVGAPSIVSGRTVSGGVDLAGAKITWLSAAGMDTWADLLAHPETTDEWLPIALGTKRVERLDTTHIYQQNDFLLLGGLVRIQRQAVAAIRWDQVDRQRILNCWWIDDPHTWSATISRWPSEAEFVYHGQGGWDVFPVSGGVSVSYAFWTEAKTMLPQIQAWAMSRTLPELGRAFEAQALKVEG